MNIQGLYDMGLEAATSIIYFYIFKFLEAKFLVVGQADTLIGNSFFMFLYFQFNRQVYGF